MDFTGNPVSAIEKPNNDIPDFNARIETMRIPQNNALRYLMLLCIYKEYIKDALVHSNHTVVKDGGRTSEPAPSERETTEQAIITLVKQFADRYPNFLPPDGYQMLIADLVKSTRTAPVVPLRERIMKGFIVRMADAIRANSDDDDYEGKRDASAIDNDCKRNDICCPPPPDMKRLNLDMFGGVVRMYVNAYYNNVVKLMKDCYDDVWFGQL